MAYQIDPEQSFSEEVGRIASEQVEKARRDLADPAVRTAVYEARKRFKRFALCFDLSAPGSEAATGAGGRTHVFETPLAVRSRFATPPPLVEATDEFGPLAGCSFEAIAKLLAKRRDAIDESAEADLAANRVQGTLDEVLAEIPTRSLDSDGAPCVDSSEDRSTS